MTDRQGMSLVAVLLTGLLTVFLLVACGGEAVTPEVTPETTAVPETVSVETPVIEDTEVAPEPSEEATSTPSPTATPNLGLSYAPVAAPELGLTLEVPDAWVRLDPEAAWAPEVGDAPAAMVHPRVGVKSAQLQPPAEPEAVLLPQPAQIVESEPVDTPLGTGRRFLIDVYGLAEEAEAEAEGEAEVADVISVEAHVLVTTEVEGKRMAYDFYAAAANAEDLLRLEPVLERMVNTSALAAVPMPAGGGGEEAALETPAVEQAKARLAEHLGVTESEVAAVSAEFVEWPDACIGVSEAGQMCAQVITPGYRVMLEVGGQTYEVHTNRTGTSVAIVTQ